MKISIIGTGMVGASFAYRLMISGLASEIVLTDINDKRSLAEADDLNHALAVEQNTKIISGNYSHTKDSDILVLTAGVSQKPGQTRLELAKTNLAITEEILKDICALSPKAILIVATNPLDVVTNLVVNKSGFSHSKVIGSGTVLDSSRFRFYLGQKLKASPRDIFAYILGEHGDSQVAVFSNISIKGLTLENYCSEFGIDFTDQDKIEIAQKTKTAAYNIIEGKGSTYYGIASSLARIVKAIVRDENVILPVSSLIQGEYGLQDLCFSLPTVIGRDGIKKVIQLNLSSDEKDALIASSKAIKSAV